MQFGDYLLRSIITIDQESTTLVGLRTQLCARKSVVWNLDAMLSLTVWLLRLLHGDINVTEEALGQLKSWTINLVSTHVVLNCVKRLFSP